MRFNMQAEKVETEITLLEMTIANSICQDQDAPFKSTLWKK